MSDPIHKITVNFITGDLHFPRKGGNSLTGNRRAHDGPRQKRAEGKVRFVCVSDTHSNAAWMENVPDGDVLIHSGDLTMGGTKDQIIGVFDNLKSLPHKIKLVVPGNHDLGLDTDFVARHEEDMQKYGSGISSQNVESLRSLWTSEEAISAGIIFLEHHSTTIEVRGRHFTVFGSGWTPDFFDWAFMYPIDKDIWHQDAQATNNRPAGGVPQDTDILITHGPPLGCLDRVHGIGSVGCPFLLDRVNQVRPLLHVFGHIHEGAEIGLVRRQVDGRETISVNASLLDERYELVYPPTVIDL